MLKVPESANVVQMPRRPQASPTDYLMAAASMHFDGSLRALINPVPPPEIKAK